MREFGLKAVVAVNRFPTDPDEELDAVRKLALDYGAHAAELNEARARGRGRGFAAEAIVDAAEQPNDFDFVPGGRPDRREDRGDLQARVRGRRRRVLPAAQDKLRTFTEQGYDTLPVCMAKTHLALARPDAPERPHRLHRDVRRHPRLHGLRLARPAPRRHADDAGPGREAGGVRRRHRRSGKTVGLF